MGAQAGRPAHALDAGAAITHAHAHTLRALLNQLARLPAHTCTRAQVVTELWKTHPSAISDIKLKEVLGHTPRQVSEEWGVPVSGLVPEGVVVGKKVLNGGPRPSVSGVSTLTSLCGNSPPMLPLQAHPPPWCSSLKAPHSNCLQRKARHFMRPRGASRALIPGLCGVLPNPATSVRIRLLRPSPKPTLVPIPCSYPARCSAAQFWGCVWRCACHGAGAARSAAAPLCLA